MSECGVWYRAGSCILPPRHDGLHLTQEQSECAHVRSLLAAAEQREAATAAENVRLRAGLDYYAEPSNYSCPWDYCHTNTHTCISSVGEDRGERARTLLEQPAAGRADAAAEPATESPSARLTSTSCCQAARTASVARTPHGAAAVRRAIIGPDGRLDLGDAARAAGYTPGTLVDVRLSASGSLHVSLADQTEIIDVPFRKPLPARQQLAMAARRSGGRGR